MAVTNPFPGVNPYLEQRWRDFHTRLITSLGATLNEVLPADLVARTETDHYVTTDRYERPGVPDGDVVGLPTGAGTEAGVAVGGSGGAAVATPVRVRLRSEPIRVHRIEIREPGSVDRVVTAVEVFSPTNKHDPHGRQKYERKRSEYLAAGVGLVEIDLLRGGRHLLYAPAETWPREVDKTYKVCVVRGRALVAPADPGGSDAHPDPDEVECELYGAGLTERLPPIHVPLRPAGRRGRGPGPAGRAGRGVSGREVHRPAVRRELDPPLSPDERRWVGGRLADNRPAARA